MIKFIFRVVFFVFSAAFLFYLALPNPEFPEPLSDSVQSVEPGDSEELTVRRAYFTDFNREEVLAFYQSQFEKSPFLNLPLPTYRLNYPPEEANTKIRELTRSTFLEEIVHPLRESFFVNGFKPSEAKDDIWYKGRHFNQKITVRYVSSSIALRLFIGVVVLASIWFLTKEFTEAVRQLTSSIKKSKIWIFR